MSKDSKLDILANPYQIYGNMLSGQRNMFLTSSIAFSVFALSDTYGAHYHRFLKMISITMLVYSMIVSFMVTEDYRRYIDIALDRHEQIESITDWKKWVYISYSYILVMLFVAIFMVTRIFNKKIKQK